MVVFLEPCCVFSIGPVKKFLGMMWQCLVWKDKRLAFNWPLLYRGLFFYVRFVFCMYLFIFFYLYIL